MRVGFAISTHINRKTGEAWPGLDHLAGGLGTNEKTVRRGIEWLEKHGHLTTKRGGKGHPTRYTLKLHDRTELSDQENELPDNSVPMSGQNCPDDRKELSLMSGQKRPTNPLNEPIEESFEEPTEGKLAAKALSKKSLKVEFDEFWNIYPRKVAKGAAEKAYSKARQSTDHESIITGARQYAAIREGQDSQFTKHPATWLNAKCWDDELPEFKSENPFGDWPEGNQWQHQNPEFDLPPGEFEKTSETFVDQPSQPFRPVRTGFIAVDTAFASEPDLLADFVSLPTGAQQKVLTLLLADDIFASRKLILEVSQNFERRRTQ